MQEMIEKCIKEGREKSEMLGMVEQELKKTVVSAYEEIKAEGEKVEGEEKTMGKKVQKQLGGIFKKVGNAFDKFLK